MTNQTNDIAGRPYAKLSELKAGDVVELDADFTCRAPGKARLFIQDGELAFECSCGGHILSGQADDGEHCVGIYKTA